MSTRALADLQRNLGRAWHTLSEGWTRQRDRAGHAITLPKQDHARRRRINVSS